MIDNNRQSKGFRFVIRALSLFSVIFYLNTAWAFESFQWQKRIVVIFAANDNDPNLQAQLQEFNKAKPDLADRDIVLAQSIPGKPVVINNTSLLEASDAQLRADYGVANHHFTVILIGKDGGEKYRSTQPIPITVLNNLIDGMPMRQSEMSRSSR